MDSHQNSSFQWDKKPWTSNTKRLEFPVKHGPRLKIPPVMKWPSCRNFAPPMASHDAKDKPMLNGWMDLNWLGPWVESRMIFQRLEDRMVILQYECWRCWSLMMPYVWFWKKDIAWVMMKWQMTTSPRLSDIKLFTYSWIRRQNVAGLESRKALTGRFWGV